jgi:hypothetical protein
MRFFALCIALAFVIPASAEEVNNLIGRWDLESSDAYYIRFKDDMTYRIVAPGFNQEGGYQLLEGGIVELSSEKSNGRSKAVERKYRIKGDTLMLKVGAYWWKYKRVRNGGEEFWSKDEKP